MEQTGPTTTQIKIWEGYLGNEESQPHTRLPNPGFQCQEEKFPQFLVAKTTRDLSQWKKLLEPQAVPLKDPHVDLPTKTHSL